MFFSPLFYTSTFFVTFNACSLRYPFPPPPLNAVFEATRLNPPLYHHALEVGGGGERTADAQLLFTACYPLIEM